MRKTASILIIILITISCSIHEKIDNIYLYSWGKKDNYSIWIIDGNRVREKIYKEFLYGGNEQRYLFVPKGEIWIDNDISSEEFDLTVAHELNERHLMAKFGWTYEAAHDSSLSLELTIRNKNEEICRSHETALKEVGVTDSYNIKEIKNMKDSIRLENIYRIPMGMSDGISVWVVDGYLVRKNIYPDFGDSGNDLAYHFIPLKEIWIDGQVSCEETEYSVSLEMMERNLMEEGKSYSDAYEYAVQKVQNQRKKMEGIAKSHFKIVIPDSLARDTGVIDPDEK